MADPQQPMIPMGGIQQNPESFTASQMYMQRESDQLLKTVLENEDLISLLEHEFRGEIFMFDKENPDGAWIKKHKPIIESEDGINEVLRMLRFMGLNKVSLLTNLDHNQINSKLATFEYKLADILFLKRRQWGIDKESMPMIYQMIISIVEDAMFRAKDGNLIKTFRTVYQHQEYEQMDKTKKGIQLPNFNSPYK